MMSPRTSTPSSFFRTNQSFGYQYFPRILFGTLLACCAIAMMAKASLILDTLSLSRAKRQHFHMENNLTLRTNKHKCRAVHNESKQCDFIRLHCTDDEAGLISYLTLFYCDLAKVKPLAFALIIAWLCTLFASIGISASDFLCINLATIANMLGMSETLAGVTFLAFGNGSPDVFSTWAAFSSHNGSLAIGELIGAAGFITAVIAGSMAIVKPFRVSRKSFLRDASFFTVAAAFSLLFLIDGSLALWESAVMVAFYLSYVVTVLLWHSFSHKRKKRKDRQNRAREHFQTSRSPSQVQMPGQAAESLMIPDSAAHINAQSDSQLLGVEEQGRGHGQFAYFDDEDDGDEDNHQRERFLANVGQEIRRTHRRTLSRMASSNQSIRPSLLGALEFGSLLASLERSRNQQDAQVLTRRHSDHASRLLDPRIQSQALHPGLNSSSADAVDQAVRYGSENGIQYPSFGALNRFRSASANAADITRVQTQFASSRAPPTTPHPIIAIHPNEQQASRSRSHGASPIIPEITITDGDLLASESSTPRAGSVLLPFPAYTDEPTIQTRAASCQEFQHNASKTWYIMNMLSGRWNFLGAEIPKWTEVKRTLFPTLDNWQTQTAVARLVSLITAPTILLLTITIPVVQIDNEAPSLDEIPPTLSGAASIQGHDLLGQQVVDVDSSEVHQSNLSVNASIRDHETPLASPLEAQIRPENSLVDVDNLDQGSAYMETRPVEAGANTLWKPWLIIIQIFAAPLFLLGSFFADDANGLAQFSVWVGFSLLGSLGFLIIFLLGITPGRVPRWHSLLAFPGFCASIAWVSLIAGEVVGVLKTIGVITQISDAILGLTIFAIGNSLSDLLANLAIAKLGYPVMALSACFGGPMLNILLGIGLGGLSLDIKKGHKHAHGGTPDPTTHFGIEVGRSLLVSGGGLLLTLIGLLVFVPLNGWMMDRKIGAALITVWSITTVINIVLEIAHGRSQTS